MQNFINLLSDIYTNGTDKSDRTGVGSRSLYGQTLRWDLSEQFPIITSRKVAFRIAFEETMFFLRGDTDTKKLEEKRINIWKANTSREFLDKRGLDYLPEGSLGKGYSFQWRNFGGSYGVHDGADQVADLVTSLKNNPTDRRHIITAWNPCQLHETPLPPCHLMQMYSVEGDRLNSTFIMRSNDVPYGLPYNIMGYALLNHIFAKITGLNPGTLVYFGWDAHIYHNQMDMVKEWIQRAPTDCTPQLIFRKDFSTLDEALSLEWEDVEIVDYRPLPDFQEKPPMAA